MKPQPRSHQIKQRRFGFQWRIRKIAEPAEVALGVMPAHAQPIIHCLHHQVNIVERFQFQHRQPSIPRGSKQVNDSAVPGGKRRHLRIDLFGIESRVNARGVGDDLGFQPAFRLRAVQPVFGI